MHSRRPILIALSLSFALNACSSGGGQTSDAGPTGPLEPPTGLVARPSTTSSQVQLSWNAEAAATGGYQIWRSIDGNDSQLDSSTVNAYLDSTAPAGTSITYSVRAVAGSDVTAESAGATALTIPAAPTSLVASSVGATSITLTWVEATGAQGGDEVSYAAGSGSPVESGATGTTFTASGLVPGTLYTFTVTARDATGAGPSAVVMATTLLSDPVDAGSDAGTADAGNGDAGSSDAGGDDAGSGDGDDAGQGGGGVSDGGGAQPGDGFDLAAYGADTLVIVQWSDQGAAAYQIFRAHGAGAYTQIAQTTLPEFADQGGSAHPIVAGDSYSYFVVPVDASGDAQDPSSPATAQALGLSVTESDQFVDDATTTRVPADFSSGVTSAFLGQTYAVIPGYADGGVDLNPNDSIQGYGTTTGLAVFPGVPQGSAYTLDATPLGIYTSMPAATRAIDLSSSAPGRANETSGDGTLAFNVTGLGAWDVNSDSLTALSWGAEDFAQAPLQDDLDTPLADGGTSFSASLDTGDLFGNPSLIESSQGDVLYLLQTESDDGGTPYLAVRKGLAVSSIDESAGGTNSVSGAMIGTPTIAEALQIHLDPTADPNANAFLRFASAVNPSATAGDTTSVSGIVDYGTASIGAEPAYSTNGAYFVSNVPEGLWYGSYSFTSPTAPQLFLGALPAGTSDVAFGAGGVINFTNVFPSRWDLFLTTYVPFTVPIDLNDLDVVPVVARLQTQGLLSRYLTSGQALIAARISPVTNPKIDGVAANAAGNPQLPVFSNEGPLVFSWQPPVLGAPTRTTVTIWSIDANGLAQTPSAVLQTTGLTASLPPGQLTIGSNYVAFITATAGDRSADQVLAADGSSDSADCVTASFSVVQ